MDASLLLERQADQALRGGDPVTAAALLDRASVHAPSRREVWVKLSAARRAGGDIPGALAAIGRALSLAPRDPIALLLRARLLEAAGEEDRAGEAYGRALSQMPVTPPPEFAAAIALARDRYGAWQRRRAAALRDAARDAGPLTPKVEAMIDAAVRLTSPERSGPTNYCYPGLGDTGFHPRERFEWLTKLEARVEEIADEYARVAAARSAQRAPYIQYPDDEPLDEWETLNHNPDWTAIHLIERGKVAPANAPHCPATLAAIAAIPQPVIAGAGPNAMFSLLAPHTHIPPHTGITNVRLVCHLPLIVPPDCWFRVGDERRTWQRGVAWIFDDTVEHEAMNSSDALRVVLIVDVWHPELSDDERAGIAAVISAGGEVHGL